MWNRTLGNVGSVIQCQCEHEPFKDFKVLLRIADGAGCACTCRQGKTQTKTQNQDIRWENACRRLRNAQRDIWKMCFRCMRWKYRELFLFCVVISSLTLTKAVCASQRGSFFQNMRQMISEGNLRFLALPPHTHMSHTTMSILWLTAGNSSDGECGCYSTSLAQHFHLDWADRLKPWMR